MTKLHRGDRIMVVTNSGAMPLYRHPFGTRGVVNKLQGRKTIWFWRDGDGRNCCATIDQVLVETVGGRHQRV